ncbi:MAG: universal stress protein [Cyclobacterium sp.]|uniref:universal stress protein n=1 Tax=Cyclobacterium sp. TaxID=1966343 RepID=UPI0039706802
MKKLLVPTDFSPYADAALDFAIQLAQKVDAEILIMHVILTPVNWVKLTKEQEKLYPDTLEVIRKAKVELSTRKSKVSSLGLEVRELIHFSDGKERLIKFLSLENIDMVIMGSHGKYGFKSHVLGSNTYTVLRKSEIPVFIIKPGDKAFSFKKVILATDFKEDSGKAFQLLGDTIRLMGGEPELLYVNTPADFLEGGWCRSSGDLTRRPCRSWPPGGPLPILASRRGVWQSAPPGRLRAPDGSCAP